MTSLLELAWAAGFYDGEGGVSFYVGRDGCRMLRMSVAQKDRRLLFRFQDAIGFGAVGKPKPRSGVSYWYVQNFEHVQAALALLWRFLGPQKREQAITALVAYRAHPVRRAVQTVHGRNVRWRAVA